MLRALYSAVSGLENHQTGLDVIANNIANVNTVAFKASRVTFKEAFVQLLQGASRPPGDQGGTDPIEVGSGMQIGSIDQQFTQGTLQTTGNNTDLAIQGDGFFVVTDGAKQYYTRAGNFQLDANGDLITGDNGYIVQGIMADSTGQLSSSSSLSNIVLPIGQKTAAQATANITMTGDLDANAAVGDTYDMSATVYDGLGTAHTLDITFTNAAPGSWTWTASSPDATVDTGTGTATFDGTGNLTAFTAPAGGNTLTITPSDGADPFTVNINAGTVGDIDGLAGFAHSSNAVISQQDGYPSGDLESISVDDKGVITGQFSNGTSRALAQIALAQFNNPTGLLDAGGSDYAVSANSGLAVIGFAGTSNTSTVTAGALENSNVDLSQEFANMIITERGFEANARVITTADQMLDELVNLQSR